MSNRSAEARAYWQLVRAHSALVVAFGPTHDGLLEIRDDLEVIALYTDWPLLQRRIRQFLERRPDAVAL